MIANSQQSSDSAEGKTVTAKIANVNTNERVPGHLSYYEKGGLRTYGDEEDHEHEPPVRCSFTLVSPSFWLT